MKCERCNKVFDGAVVAGKYCTACAGELIDEAREKEIRLTERLAIAEARQALAERAREEAREENAKLIVPAGPCPRGLLLNADVLCTALAEPCTRGRRMNELSKEDLDELIKEIEAVRKEANEARQALAERACAETRADTARLEWCIDKTMGEHAARRREGVLP